MDFAKGSKTKVMAVFTAVAVFVNMAFGVTVDGEALTTAFYQLIDQGEVIAGAIGVVYGIIMKVVRLFVPNSNDQLNA